jgi:hypothetical protein
MTIVLNKPEIELLIQNPLASGGFKKVDDAAYRALESQDAEESSYAVA